MKVLLQSRSDSFSNEVFRPLHKVDPQCLYPSLYRSAHTEQQPASCWNDDCWQLETGGKWNKLPGNDGCETADESSTSGIPMTSWASPQTGGTECSRLSGAVHSRIERLNCVSWQHYRASSDSAVIQYYTADDPISLRVINITRRLRPFPAKAARSQLCLSAKFIALRTRHWCHTRPPGGAT